MKNLIFWGTGRDAEKLLQKYPEVINVIQCFVDNDVNKQKTAFYEKSVCAPDDLAQMDFEYIVITSRRYLVKICKQLVVDLNINVERILSIDTFIEIAQIKHWIMPRKINVEACSICQLNCKTCYMRLHNYANIKPGYLKFTNFKTLLDENPCIEEIELSNNGEVFLNPEIKQILEYANAKKVSLYMYNGTNFNVEDESIIETIVKTGVKGMTLSIDGTTQDVYSIYRRNGNYKRVIENIKLINYYKKKYNTVFPTLIWQFVLMEHNEHQAEEAKLIAKELGCEIFFKLTWDRGFVSKNPEWLRNVTGLKYLSIEEYEKGEKGKYMVPCKQLFCTPQINWDGRLLGCCESLEYDFGINVFEVGLSNALKGKKYIDAKRLLFNEKINDIDPDNPCLHCGHYIYMKKMNNYLSIDTLI